MARARRPSVSRLVATVALLLSGVLVLSGCKFEIYDLPLPGNTVGKSDAYRVTADFADALNVVPRTAVMVDDVPVGQVTAVRRVGWHARITMLVRKDVKLPANAEVDVRQTSLLGEKYIALLAPAKGTESSQRLHDGSFIPLSRTGRNPEVEEVLGALSFLLSGGGVGQLHTISVELNKALNGRQDVSRDLLQQINALIGTLDEQKQNIIDAMDAVNRLTATLSKERDTIGEALQALAPALKVLNGQHAALMKMLRQLDRLGQVGTSVIRRSRADTVATLRALGPAFKGLADAGDKLPTGLSLLVSFPFPKEAGGIAYGDYSNALFKMIFDFRKVLKNPVDALPDVLQAVCNNASQNAQFAALCQQLKDQLGPVLSGAGGAAGGVLTGVTNGGLPTVKVPSLPQSKTPAGAGTPGTSGTPGSSSSSGSGLLGALGGH